MLKKFTNTLAIAAVLTVTIGPNTFAQEDNIEIPNCDCWVDQRDATGTIQSAKGDVFISSANGYKNAVSGDRFSVGSEVATGALSSAQITIGETCKLRLSGSSLLKTKIEPDDLVCVNIAGSPVQTATSTQQVIDLGNDSQFIIDPDENGNDPDNLLLLIGAGGAVGGVIWWLTRDEDDDPDRASR